MDQLHLPHGAPPNQPAGAGLGDATPHDHYPHDGALSMAGFGSMPSHSMPPHQPLLGHHLAAAPGFAMNSPHLPFSQYAPAPLLAHYLDVGPSHVGTNPQLAPGPSPSSTQMDPEPGGGTNLPSGRGPGDASNHVPDGTLNEQDFAEIHSSQDGDDISPRTKLPANSGFTPGATCNFTPVKNTSGKFDCPYCIKSYLHAKHLKRHLLRHTGDRPYLCGLCNDSFSRSDILKRHFQKCQIRMGNPSGLTHLSLTHKLKQKRKQQEMSTPSPEGDDESSPDTKKGLGKACDQCVKLKTRCDSGQPCDTCQSKNFSCTYHRNSRASMSNEQPSTDFSLGPVSIDFDDGINMPPPTHPNEHMTERGQQGYQLQRTVQHLVAQDTYGLNSIPLRSDCHTYLPFMIGNLPFHCGSMSMVPTNGVGIQSFMQPAMGMGTYQQTFLPTSTSLPMALGIPRTDRVGQKIDDVRKLWKVTALALKQVAIKDELLVDMESSILNADINSLEAFLNPFHIQEFTRLFFMNFCSHFPFIHLPTFSLVHVHPGLLLAIICTGAVYAPYVKIKQLRQIMTVSFEANKALGRPAEVPSLEEIQAIILFHIIFTWHGDLHQREMARRTYGTVIDMAQHADLFNSLPETVFHANDPVSWKWESWIQQETRNRAFYTMYLLDTAFVLWFNDRPLVRQNEVNITLPADDAAWEAEGTDACARLLGAQGEPIAIDADSTGQPKQLLFQEALKQLLDGTFKPGTTNAYSKFVLIHALHVCIWNGGDSIPRIPSIDMRLTGFVGRMVRACYNWKKCWDDDVAVQYPAGRPRVGFCRDGVPFFYLALKFLVKNRREYGLMPSSDANVRIVAALLRQINEANNPRKYNPQPIPGKEGAAAKIDPNYGVEELTWNMKLLFRPMSQDVGKIEEE